MRSNCSVLFLSHLTARINAGVRGLKRERGKGRNDSERAELHLTATSHLSLLSLPSLSFSSSLPPPHSPTAPTSLFKKPLPLSLLLSLGKSNPQRALTAGTHSSAHLAHWHSLHPLSPSLLPDPQPPWPPEARTHQPDQSPFLHNPSRKKVRIKRTAPSPSFFPSLVLPLLLPSSPRRTTFSSTQRRPMAAPAQCGRAPLAKRAKIDQIGALLQGVATATSISCSPSVLLPPERSTPTEAVASFKHPLPSCVSGGGSAEQGGRGGKRRLLCG